MITALLVVGARSRCGLPHRRWVRAQSCARTAADHGLTNLPLHGRDQNRIWCALGSRSRAGGLSCSAQVVQQVLELVGGVVELPFSAHLQDGLHRGFGGAVGASNKEPPPGAVLAGKSCQHRPPGISG